MNSFDATFKQLLSAYYGGVPIKKRKKKKQYPQSVVTYAKVFDNGETLVQKEIQPSLYEEYVVMQSSPDSEENFEEYVVQSSVGSVAFEEYVARPEEPETGVTNLYAVSSSLSENEITPAEEYRIDLTDAFTNTDMQPENKPALTPDDTQPNENKEPSNNYNDPAVPATQMSGNGNRDKEFEEDFQAILNGKKVFDPVTKKTVEKDEFGKQQSVSANAAPAHEFNNGHAIFDEIAKKMQYATAYDLGVVELDKKFNDFDKMAELQRLSNAAKAKRSTALSNTVIERAASLKPEIDTADFIKDLDTIKRGSRGEQIIAVSASMDTATAPVVPNINSTEWPLRPANLRPLRMTEKIQEFGQFTYMDDPSQFNGDGIRITNDWATQNIISVSVPQLNGKTFAGHIINNGSINFHKQGAERLRNLWAAWENAGFIDRILTFEGGYAARYIRRSANRSPRPLSNHAWGTAFDINASFNGFGSQPATVGQRGCVRELVAIANQNGFFWGGHFLTKDGMHFELGHAV